MLEVDADRWQQGRDDRRHGGLRRFSPRVTWCPRAIAAVSIAACVGAITSCGSRGPDEAPSDELSSADAAYLESIGPTLAEFFRVADPPEYVPVTRWVLPEDADQVRRACVEEAGYPMRTDGSFSPPPDQQDAFTLTQYECWMAYPILRKYAQPWGDEQIEAQYRWTIDVLIPCLEDEGYAIQDIPSRETFIDTWGTSATFYPYAQVISLMDGEESLRLEYTCPQIAPAAVLWEGEPVESYR